MEKIKLPKDIYCQCVAIAGAYYTMLSRRSQLEEEVFGVAISMDGMPHGSTIGNPTAIKVERLMAQQRNDWKIKCVEQAWLQMQDATEREFVKKNIFERIQMQYIDLPMSIRTMKRVRAKYIYCLAKELGEI